LKRRYLTRDGMKCILVVHDWGGVVGYRIAADTRGLFDRMITMNGVYVGPPDDTYDHDPY
jgi:pimeloyl-ACP methyl ester carboxylesterase